MLLSLALIMIVGFMFSEVSNRLRIPRVVGFLVSGILLGPYVLNLMVPELLAISIDLRQIALIIILLRAGLSLNLKDLKKVGKIAILLSFIPATVQASVGSIPLALGISNGNTMLTVSVLAILITAPIGAYLIDLTSSKWTQKQKGIVNECTTPLYDN
jgi:NhaP-type Na+/H+ or K+/H+ antiporter